MTTGRFIVISEEDARILAEKLVDCTDEGPHDEGWKSDELQRICDLIDKKLETPLGPLPGVDP